MNLKKLSISIDKIYTVVIGIIVKDVCENVHEKPGNP